MLILMKSTWIQSFKVCLNDSYQAYQHQQDLCVQNVFSYLHVRIYSETHKLTIRDERPLVNLILDNVCPENQTAFTIERMIIIEIQCNGIAKSRHK